MWEEQRTAIPDKQATAKITGKSNKGKELYLTEIKEETRRKGTDGELENCLPEPGLGRSWRKPL